MSGVSSGFIAWKQAFQLSPIILTGGIATAQGGALPISSLVPGQRPTGGNLVNAAIGAFTGGIGGGVLGAVQGAVTGASPANELDGFFANFMPAPGSTLIAQSIAHYPFANQTIAANATIAQPLVVSMVMMCPAGNSGTFGDKMTALLSLQQSLSQHNQLGGTYSVLTPAYIYTGCIMIGMRDVSGGTSTQVQHTYQLDFEQPLITQTAATQALNGLMAKLSNGTPISGAPAWSPNVAVNNPTILSTSGPAALSQLQGGL